MKIRSLAMMVGLAAAGGLSLSPAFAAEPRVKVHYSAAELSTDQGVQALYGRLKIAASEVCGSADTRDLALVAMQQVCRLKTLKKAVEDVRAPALTALYRQSFAGKTS